jgi:hypothetical protein
MYTIQSVSIEVASRSSTNFEMITTYLSHYAEANALCISAHILALTQQDLVRLVDKRLVLGCAPRWSREI